MREDPPTLFGKPIVFTGSLESSRHRFEKIDLDPVTMIAKLNAWDADGWEYVQGFPALQMSRVAGVPMKPNVLCLLRRRSELPTAVQQERMACAAAMCAGCKQNLPYDEEHGVHIEPEGTAFCRAIRIRERMDQ